MFEHIQEGKQKRKRRGEKRKRHSVAFDFFLLLLLLYLDLTTEVVWLEWISSDKFRDMFFFDFCKDKFSVLLEKLSEWLIGWFLSLTSLWKEKFILSLFSSKDNASGVVLIVEMCHDSLFILPLSLFLESVCLAEMEPNLYMYIPLSLSSCPVVDCRPLAKQIFRPRLFSTVFV